MFYRLCKYRIWHLFVESYNLQWFSTYPVNVFYLLCVVDIQYFVNVMVYRLWKDIICLIGIYYYYYYFCFTCLESALHEPTWHVSACWVGSLLQRANVFVCLHEGEQSGSPHTYRLSSNFWWKKYRKVEKI
jgi:hypothetical protein